MKKTEITKIYYQFIDNAKYMPETTKLENDLLEKIQKLLGKQNELTELMKDTADAYKLQGFIWGFEQAIRLMKEVIF